MNVKWEIVAIYSGRGINWWPALRYNNEPSVFINADKFLTSWQLSVSQERFRFETIIATVCIAIQDSAYKIYTFPSSLFKLALYDYSGILYLT